MDLQFSTADFWILKISLNSTLWHFYAKFCGLLIVKVIDPAVITREYVFAVDYSLFLKVSTIYSMCPPQFDLFKVLKGNNFLKIAILSSI